MNRFRFAAWLLATAAAPLAAQAPAAEAPRVIGAPPTQVEPTPATAVADPRRPAADKVRDADRKPAELLAFAGVKKGMRVVEIMPGGGYFTRLLAGATGSTGRIFAFVPDETLARNPKALDPIDAMVEEGWPVTTVRDPIMTPMAPAFSELTWTSQNYHDIHNMPGVDMIAFNKLVFAGLAPGGVYLVTDHAAKRGSGAANTQDLHRIDPKLVRKEVEAAGFLFDGESKILASKADKHTLKVFDPALRGRTDQFVFRFRKPK